MYIPKPPPPTSDSQAIVEWLEQELQALSRALEGDEEVVWFRPLAREPERPRDGQTAFANGANWDPGGGAGLYSYWSGAWRLLFGSGGAAIVESVFGRTGNVVAVEADYSAFYSLLGHLHDDRYYTETEVDSALAGKSNTGHTHTLSEVTDAGAAAAAGVKNSVEVDTGDLQLVGDAAAPGNSRYYGTDGGGVKGFHALPGGGGGSGITAAEVGGRVAMRI